MEIRMLETVSLDTMSVDATFHEWDDLAAALADEPINFVDHITSLEASYQVEWSPEEGWVAADSHMINVFILWNPWDLTETPYGALEVYDEDIPDVYVNTSTDDIDGHMIMRPIAHDVTEGTFHVLSEDVIVLPEDAMDELQWDNPLTAEDDTTGDLS